MNVNSASRISNNTPLQVVVASVSVVAHYIHNSNILYRLKDIVAVHYLVWERIVCAFLLQTNVVAVAFHLYTYLVRTYEVEVYIYLQFVKQRSVWHYFPIIVLFEVSVISYWTYTLRL